MNEASHLPVLQFQSQISLFDVSSPGLLIHLSHSLTQHPFVFINALLFIHDHGLSALQPVGHGLTRLLCTRMIAKLGSEV
jgi:hypothetical protein